MAQNLSFHMKEELLWKELCDRFFETLPSHTGYEKSIRKSVVARLIGLLPFLANTECPMRDSLCNLTIFIFSYYGESRDLFRHSPLDDDEIFDRFLGIMSFTGGKGSIIDRGMSLIVLLVLNCYKKNASEDLTANRYNPLNSGCWDYSGLVEEFSLRVRKTPCRKMDRILKLESVPDIVMDC
ncbi:MULTISPECIES: hypothetical protein [unclassified Oceanispirochaeta]|uniref:hypothetical protein n=1 Tax=unclassified Oceanispirochaeta TaxID=2635722 RepID=UPI000E08D0E9|nr:MULTISPECIES: hypothetical protein [unclassified Oceanispirochaeta]MBF9018857.1 hypothetical protein [Oceanispirochaeta sp. M2]NPD75345.1 hypothetical protein [Oceanispirochaeta sp. M1]RDG28795.1 hypothetical protein DV872_24940 [Oceanispirochaeta sp. M1]